MNEENVCPECGAELKYKQERYGEDADGNRGIWITITYCSKCDYEEE